MIDVYNCLTQEHDLRLVVLAGVICIFACLTAFNMLGRASSQMDGRSDSVDGPGLIALATTLRLSLASSLSGRRTLVAWLLAASVALGCGIWATHFVAMLAFQPGLPVGYDVGMTAVSVVIAILMSVVGMIVVCFARSPLVGGAILGAAVGSMHYTGMSALTVPAVVTWDTGYVVASLIIGIVGCAGATFVGLSSSESKARLMGSLLLALSICGLHFTGMAAMDLQLFGSASSLPDQLIDPDLLAITVSAVTLLILALAFTGTAVDQHLAQRSELEAARLRAHVAELEATKAALEVKTAQVSAALAEADAGNQAKRKFLATMSHELRTPLNAIIGFAELQAAEPYGPMGDPRYAEYSQDIAKSANHLLALINDILDLTKLEAGRLDLADDMVDVATLIDESLAFFRTQAEGKGVVVTVEPPASPLMLRCDRRRLRQVLLNLMSNAIKFTPATGTVAISAERGGGGILLAVADTGIGMDVKQIPTALDSFGQLDNRLDRRYEGTGLGLPLTKRLVELHGGDLRIESRVGDGTRVLVWLPESRLVSRETGAAAANGPTGSASEVAPLAEEQVVPASPSSR